MNEFPWQVSASDGAWPWQLSTAGEFPWQLGAATVEARPHEFPWQTG